MKTVELPVRYFALRNTCPDDVTESNIRYTGTAWRIKSEKIPLILVDFWNTRTLNSHLSRCSQIIER